MLLLSGVCWSIAHYETLYQVAEMQIGYEWLLGQQHVVSLKWRTLNPRTNRANMASQETKKFIPSNLP